MNYDVAAYELGHLLTESALLYPRYRSLKNGMYVSSLKVIDRLHLSFVSSSSSRSSGAV